MNRKEIDLLLSRIEGLKSFLENNSLENFQQEILNVENYLKRFGSLAELLSHLENVEKIAYAAKEFLNIDEVAAYLQVSKGYVYKLTMQKELTVYKPNGKNIFILRDDLNRWIKRNPCFSNAEIERQANVIAYTLGQKSKNKPTKEGKIMQPDMIQPNNYRIDEAKYKSLLKYIRLSVTEKYEFPQEIVQIDGVTIATIGNFSASTGKPKSKKTFNVSAIVASALSGKEVLKYKAELPSCKNRILYIDTEQSKCHCHKVLHRILKLAGLPTDQENDNIQFLVLREYTPDQRRDIIRWALHEEQNIGLVIIDGIRDLIHDINSPSESLDIINELMRWSSYYELHIHTVLHLNKGDDNTRGHIGTELNNKAETILQISKNNENGKISEVRAMHIRDREFTPFAFEIGEDSLPHLVKEHQFKKNKMDRLASYIDMTEQQHRTALEVTFEECAEYGYQSLLEALKKGYESIGYSRGRNTLVNLCKFLLENHAITKNGRTYSYNSSFHL